jgi:hypothetical protein
MAFWAANYPGVADAVWSRDVGLLIDAISRDIGIRGVNFTTVAAIKQIFQGTARTTNFAATSAGIDFIEELVLDIIQNTVITSPLTGLAVTVTTSGTNYITTTNTSSLSVGLPIILIGTPFGGLTANTEYYVKQIINGTQFTVSATLNGPEFPVFSSTGTLTLSQQFVNDLLTLETGSLTAAENLLDFAKSIIATGTVGVGDSSAFATSAADLLANKQFIKAEVISYINTVNEDFDYNQQLFASDFGVIVDSIAYDLVNSLDNNPTVSTTTTGVVSGITVTNGGSGYSEAVTITLDGGGFSTLATARPVIDPLTGAIASFVMTNKGRGYSSAPSVVITPDTGTGAFIRAKVVGSIVNAVTIVRPGSGYNAGPHLTLIDANNTFDATFIVRIADGVLDQPKFLSRGIGFTTADALVDGDGYADIAQVGQFVYINNLTNIPTPGANIQFEGTDGFYKLVTVREVQGPSGIIGARNLLLENKLFNARDLTSLLIFGK